MVSYFFAWQFAAGVALYRLAFLLMTTIRQYFNTGWGSLWILPGFAFNGQVAQSVINKEPQHAAHTTRTRKRRGGSHGSSRRRNQKPKRGR